MSPTTAEAPPDRFVEVVLPLLKEYSEKLINHCEQVRNSKGRRDGPKSYAGSLADWSLLEDYAGKIYPLARLLAEHASGRIEYANLDDLTALEAKIRLTEMEYALELVERTFPDILARERGRRLIRAAGKA